MKMMLIGLLLIPMLLAGQGKTQVVIQRLSEPIVLDGLSDEPAWSAISPLPLTMHTPIYGGTPTENTEIRIAYDDQYIYVSGRLYDSDPSAIQANSVIRDADRGGDFMNILFDTFNDKQNFVGFLTTPAGNRIDNEIFNDAEGVMPYNFSWNTFWDCEVVRNGQGWFAEMRIPFSSLRFQDDNGRVVFGFTAHRLISRKNERLTFPAIPPRQILSVWKPSQAREIVFEGIYRTNPVYLSPYVLLGNEYLSLPAGPLSTYGAQRKFSREAGLDLKYGFSRNMTLDVTVNTDFAQVEADDQQVNLTRFSLFYPERRQFFQERSGIFEFRYAGNRLFHSRRIGLTDAGQPVRILGGARLVGRSGSWDIGVLDMQTDRQYSLPGENFNVVRLKRNLLNTESYVGLMEVARFGDDGSYNAAVGFDGDLRVSESDYLLLDLIRGFQKGVGASFLEQSAMSASWQRRRSEGLGGDITAFRVGNSFEPGVGYSQRKGGTEFSGSVVYGWFENDNSVVRKHTPSVFWGTFLRNADESEESGLLGGSWTIDLKSGAILSLDVRAVRESLRDTLMFAENARVLPGRHSGYNVLGYYMMSPGEPLRATVTLEGGKFFDGRRIGVTIAPTWNVSPYCEIGVEYQYNRIRFPARSEMLNATIGRLRIQGALNHGFSFTILTQYNSVANIFGSSLRCRYNFREGIDAYLVYNSALWVDRDRNGLSLPAIANSVVVLKYVHTLPW